MTDIETLVTDLAALTILALGVAYIFFALVAL